MHHRSFLSMTPLRSTKIICFVATDPIHLTMTAKVSCLTPLSSIFLIGPAASPSRLLSPAADPFLLHWLYVLYLLFKKVENLHPLRFSSVFLSSSPFKLSAILAKTIVSPSVHPPSFDASEHAYNMCPNIFLLYLHLVCIFPSSTCYLNCFLSSNCCCFHSSCCDHWYIMHQQWPV